MRDLAKNAEQLLNNAKFHAEQKHNDIITPEHILFAYTHVQTFVNLFSAYEGSVYKLRTYLNNYFIKHTNDTEFTEMFVSKSFQQLMELAEEHAKQENHKEIMLPDIMYGLTNINNTYAMFAMQKTCGDLDGFIAEIVDLDTEIAPSGHQINIEAILNDILNPMLKANAASAQKQKATQNKQKMELITKLNGRTDIDPVIGREDILERTIQILCRKTKNNPIHVGEPGVGKTAIIDKLTILIDEGNVPDKLKDATVYSMNIGDLMAGTQYRGELENRIKQVMKNLENEKNPILYIDEIHNIVNAGSGGNSSLDIANLLKPYLTGSKIKFIGTTTNDEYKKYFAKDKALSRRFQSVFVNEPSIDESIQILDGLKAYYEQFHGVAYSQEAIDSAVKLSAKYVTDRYLPDKAIDLIDEAGSYASINKIALVTSDMIEEVLSKTCKIPKETVQSSEVDKLAKLESTLMQKVFGQDEAIKMMVEAIKISRAGLNDDNKPIGAFLAVGPTGVGKTEIAKVLADTMGMDLVRFDMSEYTDETSANKLIGSSAGYVGYEEGGLLTNAIRKTPSCVLLLDEIEKAHSKIFNLLLQVMDNATLTDNQGNKIDFRNVVLIMTSNAGASQMGRQSIGFGGKTVQSEAMNLAVMKTFAPEFRNRLTSILVFNSMNEDMAKKIANRQLDLFIEKVKNVKVTYSKSVIEKLAQTAHSEYGGREIKRNIEQEIKPLFVNELLFGKLKNGGACSIGIKNDKFVLKIK